MIPTPTPGQKLFKIGVLLCWSCAICLAVWGLTHTQPAPKWWLMLVWGWAFVALSCLLIGGWNWRKGR